MNEPCPDPEVWVSWWEKRLPHAEKARWEGHLAGCDSCRKDLASLAAASGVSARASWTRYAAAAGLLLAVWGALRMRGDGEIPAAPQAPRPPAGRGFPAWLAAPAGPLTASRDLCWTFGRTGEVTLASGTRARFSEEGGVPSLRLESGTAVIETSGEPIHVSIADADGRIEMQDGELACWTRSVQERISLILRSAHAQEAPWGVRVLRGWADRVVGGERRTLEAGTVLGEGNFEEFRGWKTDETPSGVLRDSVRVLLKGPVPAPLVAECRLRKLDPRAEAAVLFAVDGKSWKAPLGANLPSDGSWVRIRIERSADSVRLVAGAREYFLAKPSALATVAQPDPRADALAVLAWGGDVEVAGFRWREGAF